MTDEKAKKMAEEWADCVWDQSGLSEEDKSPSDTINLAKAAGVYGFLAGLAAGRRQMWSAVNKALLAAGMQMAFGSIDWDSVEVGDE